MNDTFGPADLALYNAGWDSNGEWKCGACGTMIGRNLNGDRPFALARGHARDCTRADRGVVLRKWAVMTVHKDDVKPDDNVMVDGHWTTLCVNDFGRDALLGRTIRGDCYGPTYRVRIRRLVAS